MFDAANARRLMVEGQVRTADVSDTDLLDAMATVPREKFLPPSLAPLAYLDNDIEIAKGRALLRPMVLAKLIQAARLQVSDRVLDVACGTGYSSAVLARVGRIGGGARRRCGTGAPGEGSARVSRRQCG